MKIEGSVPIFPTEDRDKVKESVTSLFSDASIRDQGDVLRFNASDPSILIKSLTDQSIRDTARDMISPRNGEIISRFYLNKQAALFGKVNFTEGDSTLGDIRVEIKEGVDELLDAITVV